MSNIKAFRLKFGWFLSVLLLIFLFLNSQNSIAADAAKGEKLFKANCASCHRIDSKKLTGPGLAGFMDRVPSKEWLYDWVKNSKKVIDSGDPYANKIYNEYNKTAMTPFEYLSNEDIDNIVEYVQNPPVAIVEETPEPGKETSEKPDNTLLWLIILLVVFIIVINVLSGVKRSLTNLVREKQGLSEVKEETVLQSVRSWINRNKTFTAAGMLLVLVVLAKDGFYELMEIGVYEGYAPEQPIKYSHKIHAGDNGIDCVYCHHSAEKGKTAGIPSVNVCMNCHKAISEGKTTGTSEIAKIYEAAGWNPDAGKYDKPQKAIKWVKVHNLPDFVYFNHSQHVVVGKQECQTCHGEVQTFDYPMKQESDLTMGWCVNCHRETNVAMEGNAYYDKMHQELKEKYAKEGKTSFTVNDIGGLECAKCHY